MTDEFVRVLIVGLAGWRVASLLSKEDGPYGVFEKLRQIVGIRKMVQYTELAKLWGCVWCMSVWTTAAFFGLWYVSPVIPGIFAAMTIPIVVERWARP
jgi:hypothetical protein